MTDLIEIDDVDVQERFFEEGWTDGLPIVPPTPDRVLDMMLAAGVTDPDDVLGTVPQRGIAVTVEKAAINAVMAGCKPEYFPIVVAGVSAMLDPAFNAHTATTSTGGAAICTIVSGPMAREVGMNGTHNALGSGNRANATIGRTLRLVASNVLGAKSGGLDGSSMGHPGKYTLCFAEDPPRAPWQPLSADLGFAPDDTVVTVVPSEGPRQVANHLVEDPERLLLTFAAAMKVPSNFVSGKGGQGVVVLGHEHQLAVVEAGWSRRDVQEFLAEASRITPDELLAAGIDLPEGSSHDLVPGADGKLATVPTPDDVFVVTAGGAGAGWSAYIPSWAPVDVALARAVSRRVRPPGEALPDCGPDGCEVTLPPVGEERP